jgi:hypothetical protein
MSRGVVRWFGIVLAGVAWLYVPAALSQSASPSAPHLPEAGPPVPHSIPGSPTALPPRALLNKYCVTCHNERLRTAGLMLDKMDVEDIGGGSEVWEKVLTKMRTGAMPPASMPRPDQVTFNNFTAWLEEALNRAAAAKPNPGRVAVHRLNQTEYTNAIHDLLALDINGRALLGTDEAGEDGFDNMAGALTVGPALAERYVSASRKISRLAIGDPTVVPVFETYTVPKMLNQDDRTSQDLPFGSRGGIAVHHRFPVDGEYSVKIHMRGNVDSYLLGMGRPHKLDVRLDGTRIRLFTVGGNAPGRPAPASCAGFILGDPEWEKYMHSADAGLEVRFPVRAGTRVVGASFLEDTPEPEGVVQPRLTGGAGAAFDHLYDGNPAVETLSIGGPFRVDGPGDTPSRRRVFVCRPTSNADEESCAKRIISNLARRAYRRPVTEEDVQPLLRFFEAGRRRGSFDTGVQSALQTILADPEFLVRIERDPPNAAPGSVYHLSDLELASRLSFFLWSSIPDDELLDLASRKQLRDPKILERQVRRMLADDRSKALANNFAGQWLELTKLLGAAPDPDLLPDFDENLRAAFQQETELFIESQVRADRSVVELLSANYTFVNERLARHYQIPNVYGDGFRRITFNNGTRGGLLGQGSILTVTSYANRTSPVLRGKWILENILGVPPPPPPPNVPALPDNGVNGKPTSVRERLEEHRKNPACAVCHVRMDPLGFALENFDAIGQWHAASRDGTKIDSVGALPDGTKLEGVIGLRNFLLSRREQFVTAFTQKLLAWALGRSVEYYDLPTVRKITREAAASDDRWSSIIEGIAQSISFQMGIVQSANATALVDSPSPQMNRVKGKKILVGRLSK